MDQAWTPEQITQWYEIDQGARVLPLSWFLALEQPGSTLAFLDDDVMETKYRMPMYDSQSAAVRLPRGWAINSMDDSSFTQTKLRWKSGQGTTEKWTGFTCAACHTSQISYQGTSFAVPGGQAMIETQVFLDDLNKALAETLKDNAKFERFAKKVLGSDDTAASRTLLRAAVTKLRYDSRNHLYSEQSGTDGIAYGPGRLDAVGHIYDRVSRVVEAGDTHRKIVSDAPVNYPFMWNVPQLDRVQWTAFAPKIQVGGYDFGALVRNIGEVSGVFADMEIQPLGLGYVTSANVPNLLTIERNLGGLRPPRWPTELFGALDAALVAEGETLFAGSCAACHQVLDRTDLVTPILTDRTRLNPSASNNLLTAALEPLVTDPVAACNGYQSYTGSGEMMGMPTLPSLTVQGTGLMGQEAYMLDMTAWLQVALILGSSDENLAGAAKEFLESTLADALDLPIGLTLEILLKALQVNPVITHPSEDKAARMAECLAIDNSLIAYKGRSLNGVWATAPYLHNGSVASLYDIVLPPEQRAKTFFAGTLEYDPVNAGYRTDAAAPNNTFLFDTSILGNLNGGHVYGVDTMTERQRRALVEYMKSL
ncbi:hypothetical protein ED208_09580 [Stagnimonas aquatica]|uniref:Cytochrome c domain-containing protein n=1 Tax=Stagnimonas aquatica TaxID=2689987 RepID=A0A3N0V9C3_9GAMM|nr:hypothetical protein ED208_09580 [Stagnimonas aquatica]